MGLTNIFHKQPTEQTDSPETSDTVQLSGDSSVAEWLAHPVGGAIFRDMLAKAGQKESVLRPVRRMPLAKLVSMSKGRFTTEDLNNMITKANVGKMPDTNNMSDSSVVELRPADVSLPEWQEKITPGRFNSKTVIVTGAGSGIGRATASRVAREGGTVIAVDISKERLDEFSASLPDANITLVTADITNEADIIKIINAAGDTIDGLANIAGIMDDMTPLHEINDDIWDRVFAVNVTGMMRLTRAVLPLMLSQHHGSIVNIGSEASLRGSAAGATYTASKHAIIGLTKSSAYMYGQNGIRVNAVTPGPVITNIDASIGSKLGEERINAALTLMPDAATSEELAASITFLLSDDSVNINGAILASDGGWSAI